MTDRHSVHFGDFLVHQQHSENPKSCTFQSVIQIINQFECTGSLSHSLPYSLDLRDMVAAYVVLRSSG